MAESDDILNWDNFKDCLFANISKFKRSLLSILHNFYEWQTLAQTSCITVFHFYRTKLCACACISRGHGETLKDKALNCWSTPVVAEVLALSHVKVLA